MKKCEILKLNITRITQSKHQSGTLSTTLKKGLGSSLSWKKKREVREILSDLLFRILGTREDWQITENENPGLVSCKGNI